MKLPSGFDVNHAWRWLLQETLLTKNYQMFDQSLSPNNAGVILNAVLPVMAYIRAVSFLDEALGSYIEDKGYNTRGYSGSLDGRLKLLHDRGELVYSQQLRDIKDRRNHLAHRSSVPESISELSASWEEVDQAIDTVETALQAIQLIGQRPAFKVFGERKADFYPEQFHPDKPGVRLTHQYAFGVEENDARVLEIKRSINYYAIGYSPPTPQQGT
jgi:hypothetical protein